MKDVEKVPTENCGKPVPFFTKDKTRVIKAQPNMPENTARIIKTADCFKDAFGMNRLKIDYFYNDRMPVEDTSANIGTKGKGVWKKFKWTTSKEGFLTVSMNNIPGRPIYEINLPKNHPHKDIFDTLNKVQVAEYAVCGVYKYLFSITDFNKFNVMVTPEGELVSFDESEIKENLELKFRSKKEVDAIIGAKNELQIRIGEMMRGVNPHTLYGAFSDKRYSMKLVEKLANIDETLSKALNTRIVVNKPFQWEKKQIEKFFKIIN